MPKTIFFNSQESTSSLEQPESLFDIFHSSFLNIGGHENSYNQDKLFFRQIDNIYAFCVFDGHGSENNNGEKSAEICCLSLEECLNDNIQLLIDDNFTEFIHIFETKTNKMLKDKFNNLKKSGGSTSTILVITPKFIHRAYLGDSYGYLFIKKKIPELENHVIDIPTGLDTIQSLKQDLDYSIDLTGAYGHDAFNIEEYKRCQIINEGVIFTYQHPRNQDIVSPIFSVLENGEIIQNPLPPRGSYCYCTVNLDISAYIQNSNQTAKLAMTRSFGDIESQENGCISIHTIESTPIEQISHSVKNSSKIETLSEHERDDDTAIIVMGSDGLWDVLKRDEIFTDMFSEETLDAFTDSELLPIITEKFGQKIVTRGNQLFGNTDNISFHIIFMKFK